MGDKRIAVTMGEDCAAILKEYCSFFKISQSDALYLFAKSAIQNHAFHCKKVESIFKLRQKDLDKRAGKACFGFGCVSCAHTSRCTAGLYDGLFEVCPECEHLFKSEGFMVKVIELLEKHGAEA
tara:strand:+ start:150 stop:521 length:372 start_codon:yes stop_codon:yes gene_type:complete